MKPTCAGRSARLVAPATTEIVVVCGAWHVPALDVDAAGVPNVSTDTATLRGLTKVKTAVAWVPWTHRRLAAGSGYAAGVDSPGWYRHVFDHPGSEGVARFFVDAARLVRERGGAASPDHLIAGTRLAESLSAMRGRPRVGLAEVLDAADAVMGGLDLVRRELVVGDQLGTVPESAPQVPLARDVAKAQKSARLPPRAETTVVEVDLRTPVGLRKSHLLHRLVALGVPWGTVVDGRGSSGTFRETWELRWDPELSVRLIEQAGYGTTLESAATARLLERAGASSGIVELVGIITSALFADLPPAVEPTVQRLASRAATDPDVGRLLDALPSLAEALRYGDVRSTDAGALREVVDGIVVRILAGVVASAHSLDDDGAAVLVERLAGLQGALAVLDHPARRHGLPIVLVELATGTGHGLVQGRAARLLHDAGVWSVDAVQRRLSQALSAGTPPASGAAFVEGFLAGSGSVLIHDADLLAVLDGWVSSLRPDAFDAVVALLRRTFGAFEAAERRQLMRLLMGLGVERRRWFRGRCRPGTCRRRPHHREVHARGERSVSANRRAPTVSESERRRRWRLLLGSAVDDVWTEADGPAAGDDQAADPDGDGPPSEETAPSSRPGAGAGLRGDDRRIDAALGALYDRGEQGTRGTGRSGGLSRSKPSVMRWLGDIRRYFPTPVVQVLQRDAVERLDLRQLLLEPELLQSVEPDIHLVTLLVELNRHLPDETRATARQVIAHVLADLERRLSDHTRQAVRGALSRSARTRRPRPGDIDWPTTIAANLRHWIPEHRTVVPERLVGHGRRQRSLARDVIIAVDQSGSMADSVVYASLFGGVLAQLPALRTSFVAFDTALTDLTAHLHDPVEVLFGVQLGGGTDIANALTYCQRLIERPRETVLFLVSDLYEGGNAEVMRRRVRELVESGVQVIVLLALSDEGTPAHDHDHAAALAGLGATVVSSTPDEFPALLADALR